MDTEKLKENMWPALKLATAFALVGAWHQNIYSNVPSLSNVAETIGVNKEGNPQTFRQKDMRYEIRTLHNEYDLQAESLTQTWGVTDNAGERSYSTVEIPFEDFTNRDRNELEELKAKTGLSQTYPALRGTMN